MQDPGEFHCTSNAGLGWAFGTSRTGSAHRNSNRPCEDAFALWSGSAGAAPCIAVAVADGHGDPRHDRSRTGSALAVQAAVEELVAFHHMHLHEVPQHIIRSEFRTDFPRRICRRWREAVLEDARCCDTGTSGDTEQDNHVFTRYGSTLIAAVVMPEIVLAGQIGDGDLVLVRPDGSIEYPVSADTLLIGSETRSLSSRDAHLLWRTATLDRGEGGILIAATDGISDSFDGSEGPEFEKFIRSLVDRIGQYGIENVTIAMSGWLDHFSTLASGDDMTLVFVLIRPAGLPDTTGEFSGSSTGEPSGGF